MDKEMLSALRKAGKIVASCRDTGEKMIKPGVRVLDVCDEMERLILKKGGGIAFPAQVSLNQVAAHFCPTDDDDLCFQEGDLAKLDIGVHIDGHIADTAVSVNLGEHDDLILAAKDALDHATKMMDVGVRLGEIGKTIQETISGYGFSPVRNLSGHGLGQYVVHQPPTIPNIATTDKTCIEEDMVFACEPFATTGKGSIFESSGPTIFSFARQKPVRSVYAREVLKTISTYQGLPFTTRWLTREHGKGKALLGIKELMQAGIIHAYPPLPEVSGGMVSQAEHTILFDGNKKIITTKDED